MHTWIGRHPDDGRYILTNGYDWCYFAVDDVPYFVRSLRDENGDATLVLSDGTEEVLDPPSVTANARGELYTTVKAFQAGAENRPFAAKFSRFAQGQLGPFLESTSEPGAELDRETVSLVTKRGRTKLAI